VRYAIKGERKGVLCKGTIVSCGFPALGLTVCWKEETPPWARFEDCVLLAEMRLLERKPPFYLSSIPPLRSVDVKKVT